jgi:hypothetical protein
MKRNYRNCSFFFAKASYGDGELLKRKLQQKQKQKRKRKQQRWRRSSAALGSASQLGDFRKSGDFFSPSSTNITIIIVVVIVFMTLTRDMSVLALLLLLSFPSPRDSTLSRGCPLPLFPVYAQQALTGFILRINMIVRNMKIHYVADC